MKRKGKHSVFYFISIIIFLYYFTEPMILFLQKKIADTSIINLAIAVIFILSMVVVSFILNYLLDALQKLTRYFVSAIKKQSTRIKKHLKKLLFLITLVAVVTLFFNGCYQWYLSFSHSIANNFLAGMIAALVLIIISGFITTLLSHYANPLLHFSQACVIRLKHCLNWYSEVTNQASFWFLSLLVFFICDMLLFHPVKDLLIEYGADLNQPRLFLLIYLIIGLVGMINSLWVYYLLAQICKHLSKYSCFSFLKKIDIQGIKAKIPQRFHQYILIFFTMLIMAIITKEYR